MLNNFLKVLVTGCFLFITSCTNDEKTEEIMTEDDNTILAVQETKLNAQNVFNSLPDRNLVLELIKENKITYNPDFLNDPNSVNKYTIEFFKAVNLGIYGSDLNIASAFDQMQESMMFLKCVNILSGSLGVSSVFDQKLFDRIQIQESNKDSVLEIVMAAFKKVDETLKYNNRPTTSAYVLAGCWIEGLYVSCQMAQTANSESITKAILMQKESLKHLIIMLESSNLSDDSKFILEGLKSLYRAFETIGVKPTYSSDSLLPIINQINPLRKRIVSGV
jgi:hypothetical protein